MNYSVIYVGFAPPRFAPLQNTTESLDLLGYSESAEVFLCCLKCFSFVFKIHYRTIPNVH